MNGIIPILNSAEHCFSRKQYRIVRHSLSEIDVRLQYEAVNDEIYHRILVLRHAMSEIVVDTKGPPCERCDTIGKYPLNGQTCWGCVGKGWLDSSDIRRNEAYAAKKRKPR